MSWIKSLYRLSGKEKRFLIEAVFYLLLAKITIHLFPFKRIVKHLSQNHDFSDNTDLDLLVLIKKAVFRANKLAIWRNVCLVQSVAARKMLNRRRISSSFHLGLMFENDKKLAAHAWLVSGDIFITPRGTMQFKEIMNF